MKRLISIVLIISLIFLLGGCFIKQPDYYANAPKPDTSDESDGTTLDEDDVVAQRPLVSVSLPIVKQEETAQNGTIIFRSLYQNMSLVGIEPEVADKIIVDYLNKADMQAESEAVLAEAKAAYTPGEENWSPYLTQATYRATRIDQSVLSLCGNHVTYKGTPHPESTQYYMNYDILTGQTLSLRDVLTDNANNDNMCKAVIAVLESQADKLSLYENFRGTVTESFRKSLDQFENWCFDTSGLCIPFSPYEIAPYASGTVVARIPYTALAGILKDEYFPREVEDPEGALIAEVFDPEKMRSFTQVSELVLKSDSDKIVLYTDKSVHNIEIYTGTWDSKQEVCTAESAVFAANSLTPGDAIVLDAELKSAYSEVFILYETDGEAHAEFILLDKEKGIVTLKKY